MNAGCLVQGAELKLTPTKIRRVFDKMAELASSPILPNRYRDSIFFLNGIFYAIDPHMAIAFQSDIPTGPYAEGRLYVVEDYWVDKARNIFRVKLGENLRTDLENAQENVYRIVAPFSRDEKQTTIRPVSSKLVRKAVDIFAIVNAEVRFDYGAATLHMDMTNGGSVMGMRAVIAGMESRG